MTDKQLKIYKNPNKDPRGRWRSISLTAQGYRPNQMYEIIGPTGRRHRPPEGSCWKVVESEFKRLLAEDLIYFGKDGNGVPNRKRYLDEVEGAVPWTWWPSDEVGHTDESRKEVQSIFGTQTAFDTPKPTRLIERVLQIATNPGDLVLDSFSGSGTTGHAVLKMNAAQPEQKNRRFLMVEIEQKIARDVTAERVRRVAKGYANTKNQNVEAIGGGFRYCQLSERPMFTSQGKVDEDVRFADLARHVYFTETGEPLPRERVTKSPLIAVHHGTGIYLLYNGILGDRSSNGGNILTRPLYAKLPPHGGPKVIYAAGCLLGRDWLRANQITFHQTPYEIKVS